MQKIRTLMIFVILLLLGTLQVMAQEEENLLSNPGFEGTFVEQGGEPVRLVAEDWTAWNISRQPDTEPWQNRQPIYEPAAPDTSRIRNGQNAQLFYNDTFWAHTAGLYQQVDGIEPGTELRFNVYVYVWSSSFNDRGNSEQPGDVEIEVGIDPNGGTDPLSNDIVWSIPLVNAYDAYRPYSQIATATNDTVTVWVKSTVGFPVQNTYVYVDDATLAETVGVVPDDTDEPEATSTQLATNTPDPTPTLEGPTETPVPTNTPQPTATAVPPTNTAVPPTNTPDEDPTPTREGATNTPIPTITPVGDNIAIPQPSATPAPTETPETEEDDDPPSTDDDVNFRDTINYEVRRGDTVGRLAALYGSTIDAINGANDLNEDNLIFVGQELIIPVPLAAPATSTPSPTPIPSATPEIIYDATAPATGGTNATTSVSSVYIVNRGDTLSTIASRFNTTIQSIAEANGIVNINRIFAGQRLVIPGTTVNIQPPANVVPAPTRAYVVRPGDTLYRISLAFGVPITDIALANNIVNRNLIFSDETLQIP
jgi:LysM repeat protein